MFSVASRTLNPLYLSSTAPTLPAGIFDGLTKLTQLGLGSDILEFSGGMTSIRSDLYRRADRVGDPCRLKVITFRRFRRIYSTT